MPALKHSLRRTVHFGLMLAVIVLGLASRQYSLSLPNFVASYAGDLLWALMVYLGLGVLIPATKIRRRVIIALLFSYAIEFSQLYHAPWINEIRQTRLGGLVLGFSYLTSDLVCYTLGIAIGAAGEIGLNRWTCGSPEHDSESST
ncbi:ribosomal maturation YjgA family protein [Rubripirellula reticaptiva]|uniref:DUF2809 domain-containing protein n=1 Tax=Rubripirellula reticaptiva TaxID=2528013 RepID=A0A5C6EHY5_9BACT|nr:DUF2809 domain-containing protein [Rubripirellula reticaptiva]TWU47657.1 hypothetical protein Poly59_44980 [Rubripirellula reticaptiva]